MTTTKARAIAALRIMLGLGFLYAGFEKVFQFAGTGAFNVAGFLTHATGGALPGSAATAIVNPTHAFWVSLGSNAGAVSAINVLVQGGEIAPVFHGADGRFRRPIAQDKFGVDPVQAA